jgi:hypothetical protein
MMGEQSEVAQKGKEEPGTGKQAVDLSRIMRVDPSNVYARKYVL